jgi:hypothetical protein
LHRALLLICALGCSRQNPELPDLAASMDLAPAASPDLAAHDLSTSMTSDAALGDASDSDAASSDLLAAAPRIITGGGVGDAPLSGTLHVYVIESSSGSALGGAAVHVQPSSGDALDGTTDTSGLAEFHAAGLAGPAEITASASGHTPATFIGADGTNVTLALDLPLSSPPPRAMIEGSVDFSGLPSPSPAHAWVAVVHYTRTGPFDTPENVISSGTSNQCVWQAGQSVPPPCAYQLSSRTGKLMPYAHIFDCPTVTCAGAVFTSLALPAAANRHMTLAAADDVKNVNLTQATFMTRTMTVSYPPVPSASLTTVFTLAYADAGAEGWLDFSFVAATDPAPLTASSGQVDLPEFTLPGDPAAVVWNLVSLAKVPAAGVPASLGVVHQVALPNGGGSAEVTAWVPLSTNLAASSGTYSFTAAPGATLSQAQIADSQSNPVWEIFILDGTTSFELPSLVPDPIPLGSVELRVIANLWTKPSPFDPRNFSFSSVGGNGGVSLNQTSFTH